MFNFDVGVIVEHRRNGIAEVFCNRCGDSLGTMAIGDVMRAMFNTLGRGGVLCPPCRIKTCDGCGLPQAAGVIVVTQGPRGSVRACPPCADSLVKQQGILVDALLDSTGARILQEGEEVPR